MSDKFGTYATNILSAFNSECGQWSQDQSFDRSRFWHAFAEVYDLVVDGYLKDNGVANPEASVQMAFDEARAKYSAGYDDKNNPNDWIAFVSMALGPVLKSSSVSDEDIQQALVTVAVISKAAMEYAERQGEIKNSSGQLIRPKL